LQEKKRKEEEAGKKKKKKKNSLCLAQNVKKSLQNLRLQTSNVNQKYT